MGTVGGPCAVELEDVAAEVISGNSDAFEDIIFLEGFDDVEGAFGIHKNVVNIGGDVLVVIGAFFDPKIGIGFTRAITEGTEFSRQMFVESGRATTKSIESAINNQRCASHFGAKFLTSDNENLFAGLPVQESVAYVCGTHL